MGRDILDLPKRLVQRPRPTSESLHLLAVIKIGRARERRPPRLSREPFDGTSVGREQHMSAASGVSARPSRTLSPPLPERPRKGWSEISNSLGMEASDLSKNKWFDAFRRWMPPVEWRLSPTTDACHATNIYQSPPARHPVT